MRRGGVTRLEGAKCWEGRDRDLGRWNWVGKGYGRDREGMEGARERWAGTQGRGWREPGQGDGESQLTAAAGSWAGYEAARKPVPCFTKLLQGSGSWQ